MRFQHLLPLGTLLLTSSVTLAAPAPAPAPEPIPNAISPRASTPTIPSKITTSEKLAELAAGLQQQLWATSQAPVVLKQIFDAIVPSTAPGDIAEAISRLKEIYASNTGSIVESALKLLFTGLTPKDIVSILDVLPQSNSLNVNLRIPWPPVYPRADKGDPYFSVPEAQLRAAIYIPPEFTYGKIPPLIFVPGTASKAGNAFGPNFGKLFKGSDFADVVYLNIPGFNLGDIQTNAEYVAYAINYISSISSHKKVSIVSWSQGSLDTQWTFQYFPSTRSLVEDFIPISADLRGTLEAYILCPTFPRLPCPVSVLQQSWNSTFLATFHNGGGLSAYVPTTSIYSIFDEIVQPQVGPGASAHFDDTRNVGVLNAELQSICPIGTPGGGFFTHEGVMYSSVAYALTKDALTHPGPGRLDRIDLEKECLKFVADGLGLTDVLATEGSLIVALAAIVGYLPKVTQEATIKSYAAKDVPK